MAKEIINRGIKHTLVPASASYANHCTRCSLRSVCSGPNAPFIYALIECDELSHYEIL